MYRVSVPVSRLKMRFIHLVDPGFMTRVGVHYGLFMTTVSNSGTVEQYTFWVEKGMMTIQNFFGCFAMTELGHGSNIAGLETTATFDIDSDEFIIHSPSTTATKWWIGGAAESATHAYKKLIIV